MALAQYTDTFWFPSGALATATPVRVFPRNSNTLATLWADAAGTIPLPNPFNTDALGVVTFWATVGEYWLHIDSETFPIDVGMSEEQSDLSTGISTGGELDISGSDPIGIVVAPLVGYIVDNTETDPGAPSLQRIDFPGGTFQLSGASLGRTITWWLLDSGQNVIQQATRPTSDQSRTHLVLGATVFDTGSVTLLESQTIQTILPQQAAQLVDLMDGLGPFNVSGNVISANGANLSINKSAGTLFSRSFNLYASGVLTNRPHVTDSPALAPATVRRILRTATIPTPPPVATIDPANYDVGGVLTPVGGGANTSTVQRVYLFGSNLANLRVVVQYGQSTYASLAAAASAIGAGTFVQAPVASDGALIGYIAVIRSATNLSDPAQATFVHAGKFSTP